MPASGERSFCDIARRHSLFPSHFPGSSSGRDLAQRRHMSRPLRLHAPGILHHVFARGDNKGSIFADDTDCETFLDLLATTATRFDVHCVAYCLLGNHYHLLLVPHAHPLSPMMQQLNSTYCQRFNRRHGRVGHVLQGRFGCRIVDDGGYARAVLRYIALNPVSAGLVAAPDEWQWSSCRAVLGHEAPGFLSLDYVWAAFGSREPDIARARFAEFLRAGLQETFTASLLHGSDRLAARLAPDLEPHQSTGEFVYAHRFSARLSLGALLEGCTDRQSLERIAHTAFYQHGYTLAELGRALNRDPSTVCRWIQRAAAGQDSHPVSFEGFTHARNKI